MSTPAKKPWKGGYYVRHTNTSFPGFIASPRAMVSHSIASSSGLKKPSGRVVHPMAISVSTQSAIIFLIYLGEGILVPCLHFLTLLGVILNIFAITSIPHIFISSSETSDHLKSFRILIPFRYEISSFTYLFSFNIKSLSQ